jgi:hypothetical protein
MFAKVRFIDTGITRFEVTMEFVTSALPAITKGADGIATVPDPTFARTVYKLEIKFPAPKELLT